MNRQNLLRLTWPLVIFAIGTLVFLIRVLAPTDLESYGQPANIGRLLDLMMQGNVLVQRDLNGVVIPVPPLHTWVTALFATVFGLGRVPLAIPSLLSVLATAIVVFALGRRRFGEMAGGLGAIAVVLSPAIAKHVALVAGDPLLVFAIVSAIYALSDGGANDAPPGDHWLSFWLACALATLTAGLFGALLALGVLICRVCLMRMDAGLATHIIRRNLAGTALFAGALLLWLIPAAQSQGFALAASILAPSLGHWQIGELLKPIILLLLRYLPFSIFVVLAYWRIVRHPSDNPQERSFERFLACWVLYGLIVNALLMPPINDPILALWPACALLAGRELAHLAERMGRTRFAGVAVVIGCILIGATFNAAHSVGAANLDSSVLGKELQLASDAERAAKALNASGIEVGALYHLNTPETLQLHLGTFRPHLDGARLEALLASTQGSIEIAIGGGNDEASRLLERHPSAKEIFRWPEDTALPSSLQVYRIER